MQIIFLDTETTGTPKNYQGDIRDLDNWPRIIQLAWQVAREDGELLCSHRYLIKPDGWTVPKEKFWLDHGYSTEKCEEEGRPMDKILDLFISYVDESDLAVAHNIAFDYPILAAEMIRYNRKASRKLQRLCTDGKEHGPLQDPGKERIQVA
jgi:DNA polymerase-3 subunit alpha